MNNVRPLIAASLDLGGARPALAGDITIHSSTTGTGPGEEVELHWVGPSREDPVILRLSALQALELATQLIAVPVPEPRAAAVARPIPRQGEDEILTRRQVQILRLVARGMTNRQISQETGLADATVKTYVHDAMRRLNAHTRTRAAFLAQRQGLI